MYVCMYVCKVECMIEMSRGMTCTVCTVWQVAGSSTLSYCMGRVLYLVSGMKIYSSVQEEGDCASMALVGSQVKSASSPLQQGHTDRQTDRQTQVSDTGTHRQTAHAKGPSHYPNTIRQENKHICMHVCECMRCHGVYYVLCVRVGFLTSLLT